MALFRLKYTQQAPFVDTPEIFQGAQLGYLKKENEVSSYCMVVGGLVAVVVDQHLPEQLSIFYQRTWGLGPDGPTDHGLFADTPREPGDETVIGRRYNRWLKELPTPDEIWPVETDRGQMLNVLAGVNPPPPPTRPTVRPGSPHGRGSLPALTPLVPHLPFHTVTQKHEVFYRWESWPSSFRINQTTGQIAPWTFASPSLELPFIPTGFAAVARAALPSFFPAVFRWALQPDIGTSILCGAVVPMHGQAGGGVEVCFDIGARNFGPIANQVVIDPL